MKCSHCGFEMPDTAKFCGNCGSPLVVPEPQQQPDDDLPDRALWFQTKAPMKFIINNPNGDCWNLPQGNSYIDLRDRGASPILMCENAFRFEDGQNLLAANLDELIGAIYYRMDGMFAGCSSLTELDLSNIDTDLVTSVDSMFEGCSSLFRLDLSAWDFEHLKSCKRMFWGCDSLRHVTVNGCDARTVDIVAKALAMADLHNQVMLHRE